MENVRICHPRVDLLFRMQNGVVKGPMRGLVLAVLESVHGLNFTYTSQPAFGSLLDKETMQYDGCIGLLQRNQSDAIIAPFLDVPVPGPNLTQGVVDASERVGLFSYYNRSDLASGTQTGVMDMVFAFSPWLWVCLSEQVKHVLSCSTSSH